MRRILYSLAVVCCAAADRQLRDVLEAHDSQGTWRSIVGGGGFQLLYS
jgi:hypothetical protein